MQTIVGHKSTFRRTPLRRPDGLPLDTNDERHPGPSSNSSPHVNTANPKRNSQIPFDRPYHLYAKVWNKGGDFRVKLRAISEWILAGGFFTRVVPYLCFTRTSHPKYHQVQGLYSLLELPHPAYRGEQSRHQSSQSQ